WVSELRVEYCLRSWQRFRSADATIRIFYANPAFVRKMVFKAFLLFQSIAIAVLLKNIDNIDALQWPLYITAGSSGVGFGLIPSLLADLFGVYNAGTMN
ncbi:unnamed protein product, partial [Aphanomyces euteiches]